jgi:hypothetical protein
MIDSKRATNDDIVEKAEQLGATVPYDPGINWHWSRGFASENVAEEFVSWLNLKHVEHRGVYPGFNVRWRPQRSYLRSATMKLIERLIQAHEEEFANMWRDS